MEESTDYLLSMEGISKTYPNGVQANRDVDFRVKPGEIHGLLGENGAGKTTLMKVLYGLEEMDEGKIYLDGKQQSFPSPDRAIEAGIGMVHQHFRLASSFSVAENVVLGREPRAGLTFNHRKALEITGELAEEYGFDIEAEAKVGDLSVGKRQFVEILRLLYQGAEVLILDEPTAVLTPQETSELLESMEGLASEGHTLIFITHKIQQALKASDVISVMRDGEIVAEREEPDMSEEEVSRLMVGREVSLEIEKPEVQTGEVLLEVRDLSARSEEEVPVLKEVSFSLRGGEILGVAAVQGNGQSELIEILSGLHRPTGGKIFFGGEEVRDPDPAEVRRRGTSHIPEDRMTIGVAGEATVEENLTLPYADQPGFRRAGLLWKSRLAQKARELIEGFDIRVSDGDSPVSSLSGGNMQKLILAREFSTQPEVLLAAQPTRGLDIKTIRFVWQQLLEKRSEGRGILLVSSDLPEVMALSDRIMVLYEGRIVALFHDPEKVSEEEIGLYMMGAKEQSEEGGTELRAER